MHLMPNNFIKSGYDKCIEGHLSHAITNRKGDVFVIACCVNCVYQADGVCMLDRATSIGKPKQNEGCIHYVPGSEIPNTQMMKDGAK